MLARPIPRREHQCSTFDVFHRAGQHVFWQQATGYSEARRLLKRFELHAREQFLLLGLGTTTAELFLNPRSEWEETDHYNSSSSGLWTAQYLR